jgi:D-alanine-D-alanine ligase-like ATP-grasp enzyme
MERPPRALIFTTINWAATAQLGLALINKGFEVATVAPRDHGIRKVKAIKAHYRSVSYTATASFVAWVIEQWLPDVVIPCDDVATCCLHELHLQAIRGQGRDPATIKAVIENSLGDPVSYSITEKKSAFMVFARSEGLSVPDTIPINHPRDLADRFETSSFPQVLKLDSTSSGLGVRIVNNEAQAKRAYRELVTMFGWLRASKRAIKELSFRPFARRWKGQIPSITLQHYIAGVPANRAVLCWQGEVLAGLSVEAVKTAHATGPATVVRILDNAEMAEASRHVVRCLGLSGFVGFDFILDGTSGRPFLIEMNSRPTPICHFSLDSETDMTGALFAKLTHGKPTTLEGRLLGETVALFPGEFWRDPKSDYLVSCHHDAPWGEPELIKAYARPLSPHSLSWISKLFSQLLEAFPWTAYSGSDSSAHDRFSHESPSRLLDAQPKPTKDRTSN